MLAVKSAPNWVMSAYVGPCWSKLAPSWHKVAQGGPSWFQVSPKLRPTWPHVGPCWAKLAPSWLQVGPKLAPSSSMLAQIQSFGPFRVLFWSPKASPRPLKASPKVPKRLPRAFPSPNVPKGSPRHSQRVLEGTPDGFEGLRQNIAKT